MTNLPSQFKSANGEAEYMAAYDASMNLWPVPYEHMDMSGRYGRVGQQMYLGYRHFRVWRNWGSQNIKPHVFPDEELLGMHVPTLLLIGQQEVLYDPAPALERAGRLIPSLEGQLVPRASHDMTQGQHRVVDARILEFLKRPISETTHAGDNSSMLSA